MRTQNKYFYRIRFGRTGKLRFLSQLEQIEVIRKCLRRANLLVNFSCGFHPQMKISFGPAISVGYESLSEFADVEMGATIEPREIFDSLARHLPAGFTLLEVKKIPHFLPSVESVANLAEYAIENLTEFFSEDEINRTITDALSQKEIWFDAKKQDRIQKIDLRKLIYKLEHNKITVFFLRFGPKRNIKPEFVLGHIFKMDDISVKGLKICRRMLYFEKPDGSLVKF